MFLEQHSLVVVTGSLHWMLPVFAVSAGKGDLCGLWLDYHQSVHVLAIRCSVAACLWLSTSFVTVQFIIYFLPLVQVSELFA